MKTGDFHLHSVYSDGELTVEELLAAAAGKIDYLSVTDHDVLEGSLRARELAPCYGMKAIVGVEISTVYRKESVHILGYFGGIANLEIIEKYISETRKFRIKRLYAMKEKLKEHFGITLDVTPLLRRHSITRGSISMEIVHQNPGLTIEYLFREVIGTGCPAYLPCDKLTAPEAIGLIHKAGGKAVLAHPVLLKINQPEDFIAMGIDGIEAIYPSNNANDEKRFRELALKNKLFVSGGSDFHAFNDSKHGNLGDFSLKDAELRLFLKEVSACS